MNRGNQKKGASGADVSVTSSKSFLSVAAQLALIIVAGLIVFKTVNDVGFVLFTFHPTFMAIGYLILMAQAILAIPGLSILAGGSTHNKRVTAHWVLQTLAIVLITIAQVSIYTNKERYGKPHYQTIHSYFGCFTYLSTLAGIFGGTAAKYSTSLTSIATPVKFKISHGTLGAILYVIVILTICLGINQTWASEADSQLRLITMGILVVSCFFVVTKSIQTALARVASLPKKK